MIAEEQDELVEHFEDKHTATNSVHVERKCHKVLRSIYHAICVFMSFRSQFRNTTLVSDVGILTREEDKEAPPNMLAIFDSIAKIC